MTIKRLLAISDISCVGKCSLTVALPVISALGIEVSVLPTALLSTHTGDFKGYYLKNLSAEMAGIIKHFEKENFKFDCIYSGYLSSADQVDIVCEIIDKFKAENAFSVVDPAMADNGKLYANFEDTFPSHILKLCKKADYILPNLTECLLLTNEKEFSSNTLRLLNDICGNFVVTSITQGFETGVLAHSKTNGKEQFIADKTIDGIFHGAGDLYASALTGCLLLGIDFIKSAELAKRYVYKCIKDTKDYGRATRLGLLFEKNLPEFVHNVYKNL